MKPYFVDLFCGIGIGALGLERAGMKIVAAVDIDSDACQIYEKNLGIKPIVGNLRQITGQQILKNAGLKKGELFACVGCPPCQGFSSLRRTRLREGQRDNRKSLLAVFAERIAELGPKLVILENVSGLAIKENRFFFNKFLKKMLVLKYNLAYGVLDAADYGVPQRRRRVILIGVKGRFPTLPVSSHCNPRLAHVEGKLPWRTVEHAIRNLPPLKAGQKYRWIKLHAAADHGDSVLQMFRMIPRNGGGRKDLPMRLWLPCHKKLEKHKGAESVYGRMWWNQPSPTITTRSQTPSCGRFIHPSQNRGITLKEAARLQSIPDNFKIWGGSKEKMGEWIGNAMPTTLAKAIGETALEYLPAF